MSQVDVSVVIPVFNAENSILRCLDSATSQTMTSLEVIVVDDGSTDATAQIVDEYAATHSQVRVFHITNGGQGLARNFGVGKAVGEYIGFIDADDFVEISMYATLLDSARRYASDLVWSFCTYDTGVESSPFGKKELFETEDEIRTFISLLIGGRPSDSEDSVLGMSVWRCLYRRDFLLSNQIAFLSERMINSEDLLFNIDCLVRCKRLSIVDAPLYHLCYSANPESFSKRYDEGRIKAFLRLHTEMRNRIDRESRLKGCELRADRRLIANARVCVKLAVMNTHSINEMVCRARSIIALEGLREVLQTYPYAKLPILQRVFTFCMKANLPCCLVALTRLRYLKEG